MESRLPEFPGGLMWLDAPPYVRSTRLRLFTAMGVASIGVAALLTLDVELNNDPGTSTAGRERPLSVDIRSQVEQTSGSKTVRRATAPRVVGEQPLMDAERGGIAAPRRREAQGAPAEPPVLTVPARDWNNVAERIAEETVDVYFRKENARASMWRQTHSVMFQPEGEMRTVDEGEPLLANLTFREPAGVLGLGFTVGSCFIGLPLAGIPVEERSTAITLIYCRE